MSKNGSIKAYENKIAYQPSESTTYMIVQKDILALPVFKTMLTPPNDSVYFSFLPRF